LSIYYIVYYLSIFILKASLYVLDGVHVKAWLKGGIVVFCGQLGKIPV